MTPDDKHRLARLRAHHVEDARLSDIREALWMLKRGDLIHVDERAEEVHWLRDALDEIAHMGNDAPATWSRTEAEWLSHRATLMQDIARTALKGSSE